MVSAETLSEARSLMRVERKVEAAAVLLRGRAMYDEASATSGRDGGKVLAAALEALTMDSVVCLGLSEEPVTSAGVRRRYKELARLYHPDKNKGATNELFQAITAAYNELLAEALKSERVQVQEEPKVVDERPAQKEYEEDPKWEKMFWKMTSFKLAKGHCYAPRGTTLGDWAASMRLANENRQLNNHRRARLESGGFNVDDKDWRLHTARPGKKKQKNSAKKENSGDKKSSIRTAPSDKKNQTGFLCGTHSTVDDDDDDQDQDENATPWSWFGGEAPKKRAHDEKERSIQADSYEIALFGVVLMRIDRVYEEGKQKPPSKKKVAPRRTT